MLALGFKTSSSAIVLNSSGSTLTTDSQESRVALSSLIVDSETASASEWSCTRLLGGRVGLQLIFSRSKRFKSTIGSEKLNQDSENIVALVILHWQPTYMPASDLKVSTCAIVWNSSGSTLILDPKESKIFSMPVIAGLRENLGFEVILLTNWNSSASTLMIDFKDSKLFSAWSIATIVIYAAARNVKNRNQIIYKNSENKNCLFTLLKNSCSLL